MGLLFSLFALNRSYNIYLDILVYIRTMLFKRDLDLFCLDKDMHIYNYKSKFPYLYENSYASNITVLYFHGSGGSIFSRGFIVKLFRAYGINFIMPEYPLTTPGLLTYENTINYFKDIDIIIDKHKVTITHVWGTSLGGFYAKYYAKTHSNIKNLILFHSPWNLKLETVSRYVKFASISNDLWLLFQCPTDLSCKIYYIKAKCDTIFPITNYPKNAIVLYTRGSHGTFTLTEMKAIIKSITDLTDYDVEQLTQFYIEYLVYIYTPRI